MALLLDVFGFLSVVLRGLTTTAQSLTLGGIAFVVLLARPLEGELGTAGPTLLRRAVAWTGWSAAALALVEAASTAAKVAVLAGTVDLAAGEAMGAGFAVAGAVVVAAAFVIALLCLSGRTAAAPMLVLAGVLLAAQAMTTHAAGRIDGRIGLALVEMLHQAAAAVWIGGIPYFVMALILCRGDGKALRIGSRFSRMAMASVLVLFTAGCIMSVAYIGRVELIWGTAYGIMVATKVILLGVLLVLGGLNFLVVERLRRSGTAPVLRMRRFAEAEIGIGIAVFFAAASLTSLPPAIDLAQDRATWGEIVERMTPRAPRLTSPDHADLAIPQLQTRLDAAAADSAKRPQAFIPGAGDLPPQNAADVAWSEYNHNWAGILVLTIGLLALLERTGRAPWARHWPLLFLVLGAFLFVRSDPENWPLGEIGFWESFRDSGVVQHRMFVVLIVIFGLFEWSVRTGRLRSPGAALVFPLICAAGGTLLLTHTHPLTAFKESLLIELTHVPLAVLGIGAGWARWLELRLEGPVGRVAAWIWPVCFALVGLLLLAYRES